MQLEITLALSDLNAELLAAIDDAAERIRGLFITNTASQPSVYLQKEAEALALMADPETTEAETPNLTLEAVRTGDTRFNCAVVILTQAETWRQISAEIEDRRLGAKDAVRTATTHAAKRAAAVIDWSDFEAIAPPP